MSLWFRTCGALIDLEKCDWRVGQSQRGDVKGVSARWRKLWAKSGMLYTILDLFWVISNPESAMEVSG